MDGKKLIPSLKRPFDAILEANKTKDWLGGWDDFRTGYWVRLVNNLGLVNEEVQQLLTNLRPTSN